MQGLAEIIRDNDQDHGTCHGLAIPNLETRNIIQDACAEILESTQFGDWTDEGKTRAAFWYIRGRFDQLRRDRNPATAAFAGALLVQVQTGGTAYVIRMIEEVTGQRFTGHD